MTDTHSDAYRAALVSEHWRELRAAVRAEMTDSDGRVHCEWCGIREGSMRGMGPLALHHIHYLTLGREAREDVLLLCPYCHKEADIYRAWQSCERERKRYERELAEHERQKERRLRKRIGTA